VHRDIKKRALLAFAAIIVWFLFYFLVYLFYTKRKSNDKKVVVSYEPLSVSNQADDCFQRIIQCIAKEYTNPDLTVNTIAREVGVLPAKVTRILQNKKQCSYKQYLNAIRLKEAKRLLQETDRNITDIAYKVGYRNVTHFNRIFKQMEGISPRSYRSGNSP
jgi:YesN/AraC family two-component response regulator